jgi:Dolichyl-phosphate-mannose-protein mannosyltransferase
MVATLPVYLAEGNELWLDRYLDPGEFGRSEFMVATQFINLEKERFLTWISLARTSSILFSLIGLLVCYYWACMQYGQNAGWIAALLWTFSPFVLGFGAVLTPDVPSASMGAMALFSFIRWLRGPTFWATLFCGFSLGLAELNKSTWIVLPPVFLAGLVLKVLQNRKDPTHFSPVSTKEFFGKFVLVLLIGWLVFVAGYGFDGLFRKLGDFELRSSSIASQIARSKNESGSWLHRSLANIPVPLPKQYVIGIDFQKHDVQNRHQPTFFFGELREEGVWYYYFFGLVVKSTIGGIALFLVSCVVRIWKRRALDIPESIILLTTGLVLLLLSSHIGLNKHSRYLLPIVPCLIVWVSQTAACLTHPVGKIFVPLAIVSSTASSLLTFPHSMSYFNEMVGGSRNGRFLLSNSNVDWNQDLYLLKYEIARRGWSQFGLACYANYDIRILGMDFFVPPVNPTPLTSGESEFPQAQNLLKPGRYAVSVCHWQGYPVSAPNELGGRVQAERNAYSYFQEFTPIGMVGYSILLFDLSQADIDQSITWGTMAGGTVEYTK